jgi:tape measure domain-containing protein
VTISERVILSVDGAEQVRAAAGAVDSLSRAVKRTRDAQGRLFSAGDGASSARAAQGQSVAQRAVAAAMGEQERLAARLANFDEARFIAATKLKKAIRDQEQAALRRAGITPAGDRVLPRTLVPTLGGALTFAGGLALDAIRQGVQDIAVAAVRTLAEGVRSAAQAAAFRQDTERGLAIVLRSAQAAKDVYRQGLRLAGELGQGAEQTLAGLQGLIARGFPVDEAVKFTRAMADLAIVNPGANLESIMLAVGKIRGQGKAQGDELMMLAEAGLNMTTFYEKAAKVAGKSIDEIKKMQDAGKLTSEIALPAILESVKALTGKELGGVAKAATGGLSGLGRRLSTLGETLLLSADFGPAAAKVERFASAFLKLAGPGTPLGDKLVATIEKIATAAADLLGGERGAAVLADALDALADVAEGLVDGLRPVGPIVLNTIEALNGMLGVQGAGITARQVGEAIAYLARAVVTLGAVALVMYARIVQPFIDTFNGLQALAQPAESTGRSIGNGIVRGLISAMTFGLSEVTIAGIRLGGAATDGVAQGAQVASPSRATMRTGRSIAEGQALGMLRGLPAVDRAAVALGRAGVAIGNDNGGARPLASGVAPGGALGGGGAVSVTVVLDGAASSQAAGSPAAAKAAGQTIGASVIEAWMRRRAEAA